MSCPAVIYPLPPVRKKSSPHPASTLGLYLVPTLNLRFSPTLFGGTPTPPPLLDNDCCKTLDEAQELEESDLPDVPGYSDTDGGLLAPPASMPTLTEPPSRDQIPQNQRQLSEETVRAALLSFVAETFYCGKRAARTMLLNNITTRLVHHYILETFSESRSTQWAFKPYGGGEVDDASHGIPPLPWDIPNTQCPVKFTNYTEGIQVPHTEVVKTCFRCCSSGSICCRPCRGQGNRRCWYCRGSGYTRIRRRQFMHMRPHCALCRGRGYIRCFRCSGDGHLTCPECQGAQKLKHFLMLTITWHTHTDDVMQQLSSLLDVLVTDATWETVFEEEAMAVLPVKHCMEDSMNVASTQLLEKHKMLQQSHKQHRQVLPATAKHCPEDLMNVASTHRMDKRKMLQQSHKQHRQRHSIKIIPTTEVDAEFKKKKHKFYIYGVENKVYFPTYPQMFSCGCTIM